MPSRLSIRPPAMGCATAKRSLFRNTVALWENGPALLLSASPYPPTDKTHVGLPLIQNFQGGLYDFYSTASYDNSRVFVACELFHGV